MSLYAKFNEIKMSAQSSKISTVWMRETNNKIDTKISKHLGIWVSSDIQAFIRIQKQYIYIYVYSFLV